MAVSVLAQRAVEDSPRWTRAMGDQSGPIPEERTSELGGIINMDARSQRHFGLHSETSKEE